MKTASTLALGLALAFGAAAAPAVAKPKTPAEAPKSFSPKVREAVGTFQKAIAANDIPGATAAAQAAEAGISTDDDRFVAGQMWLNIGQKSNDQAVLSKGLGLMLDSGKTPADQVATLNLARGKIAYNANDYRTAIASMQAAQKAGSTDPDLLPVLVTALNQNGQTLLAMQTLNQGIAKQKAAGQAVPEDWYQRGLTFGYRPKTQTDLPAIAAEVTTLTQSWVASYPTATSWHDTIAVFREQNKLDTDAQLDLFRLQRAVGGLKGQGEYLEYADDVYLRYPQEAATILQEGIGKGVINAASNRSIGEVQTAVKAKIPADKASLPGSDKAARTAANGRTALNTADAYVGYGDYAKAVDLYKVALAKGGVDTNTVNLRLGAALAQSGDAAGAKAAFAAVTGPRKPIADFWTIHLDHPTKG